MSDEKAEVKPVKQITVGFVASWVFGILFVLSGVAYVSTASIAAFIYFATGLFILPPINELIVKKTGIKLSGAITAILVIILAIIASTFQPKTPAMPVVLTGNNNIVTNNSPVTQPAEAPKIDEPKKVDIVPFKTSFKQDEFDLAIDDVAWLDEIDSGNQFIKNYTAKNKVLRVRLSGENKGKKESSVYIISSKIVTKDGYEFKTIDEFGVDGQISESQLPKGFSGCLSCGIDPFAKAKQYVYFDLPQKPLSELSFILDDKTIALE